MAQPWAVALAGALDRSFYTPQTLNYVPIDQTARLAYLGELARIKDDVIPTTDLSFHAPQCPTMCWRIARSIPIYVKPD